MWAAAIIPTSTGSFTVRNTDPAADHHHRYRKRGEAPVFNLNALYGNQACFVVEGEVDCLSIIEAGGAAVALGSASEWGKLIAQVDQRKPTVTLLLTLDNDSSGLVATKKLVEALTTRGILFFCCELCVPGTDINDELCADRQRLTEILSEFTMKGD